MAKTRVKKPPKEEPKTEEQPAADPKLAALADPKAVHELLGLPGPYEPPPPPIPTKGYVTWWDPGCSVQTLAKKKPELFHLPRLYVSERCAKDSDSWRWRLWKIEPIPPGLPFEEQQRQLKTGDEPAAVRELVSYLVLHVLTTGERLDLGRLRCKDKAESGQRMTVWLSPMGFDLASVSDSWKSPGIGLSVVCTPVVARKK